MSAKMPAEKIAQAIQDPASVFASPEAVVADPSLSPDEKKKILDSWKTDATLLMTAEQENMESNTPQGTAAEKLRRIAEAEDKV
jgi:hypothetical protein